MARDHARIIQHPFTRSLQGALLDSYHEERHAKDLHITLNIRSLERLTSEVVENNGIVHERVQGSYVPAELHFSGVLELKNSDVFKSLVNLSFHDPARTINDLLCWRKPETQEPFYLFFMQAADNLMFFARHLMYARLSQGGHLSLSNGIGALLLLCQADWFRSQNDSTHALAEIQLPYISEVERIIKDYLLVDWIYNQVNVHKWMLYSMSVREPAIG